MRVRAMKRVPEGRRDYLRAGAASLGLMREALAVLALAGLRASVRLLAEEEDLEEAVDREVKRRESARREEEAREQEWRERPVEARTPVLQVKPRKRARVKPATLARKRKLAKLERAQAASRVKAAKRA